MRERQRTNGNLDFLGRLLMVDDPLYLIVADTMHLNVLGMHRIAQGMPRV